MPPPLLMGRFDAALGALAVLLWAWMLASCIRRDPDRHLWLWLLLIFPVFGGVIYFFRWLSLNQVGLPRFLRALGAGRELARLEADARNIGNAHQFLELGDLLWRLGRVDRAAEAYGHALERDPQDTRALWSVARACIRRGELAQAREHLEKVMAADPDYRTGDAALAYGRTLLDLGQAEAAREHLEADLKRRGDPESRILLARALLELGHPQDARERLEALRDAVSATSNPRTRLAARELWRLLRRSGSRETAGRAPLWLSAVAGALGRHPFLVFGLVAALVVVAIGLLPDRWFSRRDPAALWGAEALRRRGLQEEQLERAVGAIAQPRLSDEALAARTGFEPDVLQLLRQRTGGTLEQLVGRSKTDGEQVLAQGIQAKVYAQPDGLPALVRRLRRELARRGYLAFWSHQGIALQRIGVIRGADPYAFLRLKQTNGDNYGLRPEAVIAKLKEWAAKHPFEILGADFDWVLLYFPTPPRDAAAFAQEVYRFCPDSVDQGAGTIESLARELRTTRQLFLWWD